MITEFLFILLFTLLLVILLVPVGGYRTYRTRFRGRRVRLEEPELSQEEEGQAIGIGMMMLFFFFLIFPLLLLGNVWIAPYGPAFMGISFLPLLIFGLLIALLLAAVLPRENRSELPEDPEAEAGKGIAAVFGVMFFVFLFIALASLGVAYI